MRKLILVLFISALLAACSSEEAENSANTADETAAEAPMAEEHASEGEPAEADAPAEAGHEQEGN